MIPLSDAEWFTEQDLDFKKAVLPQEKNDYESMHNVRLHYSKKTCVVAKMHGQ
jgi:hypothetical protein